MLRQQSGRAGWAAAALTALLVTACGVGQEAGPAATTPPATVTLSTSAFAAGEPIPAEHTCDGADTPPPLRWEGLAGNAQELALLVTDLDAPGGEFVHWVVAGLPASEDLDVGLRAAVQGTNDFGDLGYGGPCPPRGDDPHRYMFTLLVLDEPLGVQPGVAAEALRQAANGHVLARGELIGTYRRP